MKGTFGLLLAAMLAGCAGTDVDFQAPREPSDPPAFWLSGCTSRAVTFFLPGATHPGQPPPGWEADDLDPASLVLQEFWMCQRLNLTPFERPVALVFEGHRHFRVPPQCDTGGSISALHRLWINDRQVANHLKEFHGVPAEFAEINRTQEDMPAEGSRESWFWLPDGGTAPTTWTFILPPSQTRSANYEQRWYWYDQGSELLRAIDSAIQYQDAMAETFTTVGSLHEPALGSNFVAHDFAQVKLQSNATAENRFLQFEDVECSA